MSDRPSPPFFVEFKENPGFLGREADLEAVHHALQTQPAEAAQEAVGIVPAGVTGMGGIGKTQLAVKYVYAYREHYPDGIYWLNGANSLYQEFASLGRRLQGMEADLARQKQLFDWLKDHFNESELRQLCFEVQVDFEDLPPGGRQDKARELVTYLTRRGQLNVLDATILQARPFLAAEKPEVRRDPALDELVGYAFGWLQARPQALLVLDNLEQPERLHEPVSRDWIVARLTCPVLFTTRRHDLPGCRPVELTVLPKEVALKLLLRHRPGVIEQGHMEHQIAKSICHSLGYLPLALEVASAHLKLFPNTPLQKYQAELHQRGMLTVLADERAPVKTRHETGLQAVLGGQWQQLPSEEARQLLRVAGQLPAAAQIPAARLGLLAGVPEERASFFDMTLDTALAQLVDASLLEKLADELVRLHPLVCDFAYQQVPPEAQEQFKIDLCRNLAMVFEDFVQLEKQACQRGIDALQEDLLITIGLLEPLHQFTKDRINILPWYKTDEKRGLSLSRGRDTNAPERLKMLLRLIQQEMHTLRSWQPDQQPVLFAQQLAYCAQGLDLKNMSAKIFASLSKKNAHHLRLVWSDKPQSLSLVRTMYGHSGGINGLALTPDGKWVVSASNDHTLRVWSMETGAEKRTLKGHLASVNAVVVSPDGHKIISASDDFTLKVWDLETGIEERTFVCYSAMVKAVAITPDGKRVVSASSDDIIRVWNLETAKEEINFRANLPYKVSLAVTSDGKRIIVPSGEYCIRIWNLHTGLETCSFTSSQMQAVVVTPDGQRAICGLSDDTLMILNLERGVEYIEKRIGDNSNWVTAGFSSLAVTADGNKILSTSNDGTLKEWNLELGRLEKTGFTGHSGWLNFVAVTPDGSRAITAGFDGTLKIWDLKTGRWNTINSHSDKVFEVAIASDERRYFSCSDDGDLKVWNSANGELEVTFRSNVAHVKSLAILPDKWFAVFSTYSNLFVWDIRKIIFARNLYAEKMPEICLPPCNLTAMAMSPDGALMIIASVDRMISVWNFTTGEERRLGGHEYGVRAILVTPDGKRAVSASDDHTLKVWNLATGEEEKRLRGHTDGVRAVAVTLDGRQVVSASQDRTLKVWHLATGAEERTLRGHAAGVNAVAVTPDGQRAISASTDRTLKVWHLATGKLLASIELDGSLYCVALAADGATIVTGDGGGSVYCLQYIEPNSSHQ